MREYHLLVAVILTILLARSARGSEDDCVVGEDGCPDVEESASDIPDVVEGQITVLTDSDIRNATKDMDMLVVIFYAPWCHHCHNIISMFEDVADSLKSEGIHFSKLDIESNKETKARYQIAQVPDVRIFQKGEMFHYQGPGEDKGIKAIADYILKEKDRYATNLVIELTEDNFDNIVNSAPLILVEFYAEWCDLCQQLEPHYAAAARRLDKEDPPIPLGRVGVPEQIEVAKRFGIGGYPLLIMFRDGKQYNYTGQKNEDSIVNYMLRQAGPSSQPLSTAQEVRKFIKSLNEPRVIGYFGDSTDDKVMEAFQESGNLLRMDMKLGHCTDPQVAMEMGQMVDTIVVYHGMNLVSKYDEPGYSVIPSSPRKADKMEEVLLANARPLVGEFTTQNQLRVYDHRPLLVTYLDINWKAGENEDTFYWHDLVASVAKDFRNNDAQLMFAIANEADFEADLKILGLSETSEDVAVGIWAPKSLRYPMSDEDGINANTIRGFVNDFLNKQLKPRMNSEPKPKWNRDSLIHKVVGTTFDSIVLNPAKNVMVKLCINDKPDCKEAESYYIKAAARYEGSEEVLFTEMNLALNDLPVGITTNGELPSFLFSRKDSRDTIQVTPKPQDDADLVFFLKFRNQIRPTRTEQQAEKIWKEGKGSGKGKKQQEATEKKKKIIKVLERMNFS